MCKTQHIRHSFVASSSSALLLTDTCRSTVGPGTREDYASSAPVEVAKGTVKECMAQFLSIVDGSKAADYGNAWSAVANNRGVAASLLF